MLYPHFRISIITEKSYTKINVVIPKMSKFRYVGRLRRYGYLLIFKIAAVRNLRFLVVREKHVSVWITARGTFNSILFVG